MFSRFPLNRSGRSVTALSPHRKRLNESVARRRATSAEALPAAADLRRFLAGARNLHRLGSGAITQQTMRGFKQISMDSDQLVKNGEWRGKAEPLAQMLEKTKAAAQRPSRPAAAERPLPTKDLVTWPDRATT